MLFTRIVFWLDANFLCSITLSCALGARILAHLANDFHREGGTANLSIGSACIGGGQGIAVLLEKA